MFGGAEEGCVPRGRGWSSAGAIWTLWKDVSWERRCLGNFHPFRLLQSLPFPSEQVFSRGRRLVSQ